MEAAPWARGPFEELAEAAAAEGYAGWDPYDALSSPLVARFARTRLLRQGATQAVKSLPFNVRPALAVPRRVHTKGLALFLSALARVAPLPWGARYVDEMRSLGALLLERALPTAGGSGWGYDFPVQTRWGRYEHGQPNAVVTAFAAHALFDAADVLGDQSLREAARGALGFARSELLTRVGDERFFAYYEGSRVPVHNANLLIASLFARAAEPLDAAAPVRFSLARGRTDGSWPYGEGRRLDWVDGYHTAYVLWILDVWERGGAEPDPSASLAAGMPFYLEHLFDADGAARATVRARYPIDIHGAASAVWALSELAGREARALPTAERVLRWTLDNMRLPNGRFAFQRRRAYTNATSYVRWNDGHMLLALGAYLRATASEG